MTAVLSISRRARDWTSKGRGSAGRGGCPVMPHAYRRSTRNASHRRKISPTLARLRTSSSTTLIGARGRRQNASDVSGLRATSSAVERAGQRGEGGGGGGFP